MLRAEKVAVLAAGLEVAWIGREGAGVAVDLGKGRHSKFLKTKQAGVVWITH